MPIAAAQPPEQPRASYRAVLRQRTLLALVGLNVLYVCAGYAAFQSALPIFAKAQPPSGRSGRSRGSRSSRPGMWLTGTVALLALLGVVAGECALPVQTMLVSELAPPELRGRCLGLLPASYAVALSVGPALIGVGLSVSPYLIWAVAIPVLLGAGACALPTELRLVRVTAAPQPAA